MAMLQSLVGTWKNGISQLSIKTLVVFNLQKEKQHMNFAFSPFAC